MAGTQAESSGNVQNEDMPPKKKKLSFKAFRQLFSRRKRAKSSTDKIPEETEEGSQLPEQKHLSLSHDSVFMEKSGAGGSEAAREDSASNRDTSRSMTSLIPPQPAQPRSLFSAELSKAVKGRRGDGEEETVTIHSELQPHNSVKTEHPHSDTNMMNAGDSSGEELEEEFFKSPWSGAGGAKVSSSEHSDDNELDLNMVKSTSSLDTKVLGHRRQVRPKNVRPLSRHPRAPATATSSSNNTGRSTSPKPHAASVQVLPQLKEDSKEAAAEEEHVDKGEEEEEEVEVDVSSPSVVPAPKPLTIETDTKAEILIPKAASPQMPSPSRSKPTSPVPSVKPSSPKPSSPNSPAKKPQESSSPAFQSVLLRKTSQREGKADGDDGKVMLRGSTPGLRHDPTKRTTIAVGADVSIFGERKIGNKRSSLTEAKDWEEGAKEDGKEHNEFAAVFNKFQRRTSLKLIELQKEGESIEEKRKKEKQEVEKTISQSKSDPQEKPQDKAPQKAELAAKLSAEKKAVTADKQSGGKTVAEAKPPVSKAAKSEDKTHQKSQKKVDFNTKASAHHETKTPAAGKVETKTPAAGKVEKKTSTAGKVETKTSTAGKVETKTPTAGKVETKTPAAGKVETKTSTAGKVETKTPTAGKVETKTPTAGKVETKTPTAGKVETKTSTAGKVETNTPAEAISVPAKTVTLVIEKEPQSKVNSGDNKENSDYKRFSPISKNRECSQTLPEQPTQQKIGAGDEGNSEGDTGGGGERGDDLPSSTSPRRSSSVLLKSSSQRVQPKRLVIPTEGGGSTEPAWFEAARKKRTAFQDDQPKEQKEQENNAKKNEEEGKTPGSDTELNRGSRKSTVQDMVSRWQQT